MSLIESLRPLFPRTLWRTAGFCKRLPAYWKLDQNENLRIQRKIEGLPLFVTPEICLFIPESVTAYIIWRNAGIECPTSSVEAADFVKLTEGRSALIDIGAQTGFMSSLFARSRCSPAHILSMEPDSQVHAILHRARELNMQCDIDWEIRQEAVADNDCGLTMPISNWLYESGTKPSDVVETVAVPSRTLAGVLETLAWTPDVVKIDVESFEYEILTSSLALLADLKPALQLEVHWEILRQRGLDASHFLNPLADIGYRGIRTRYRGQKEWNRAGLRETVSRLSLRAD